MRAAASTSSADLETAFDTRAVWTPAVTGRIAVNGLDGGSWYYGDPTVLHKATFRWLTSGLGTALYVASDTGTRSLDFLGGFGSFSSVYNYEPTVQITDSSHPAMLGSTSATLGYYGYGASKITVPADFEVLVVVPQSPPLSVFAARDVLCAP